MRSQLPGEHTAWTPIKRPRAIIHISISILAGTHLQLSGLGRSFWSENSPLTGIEPPTPNISNDEYTERDSRRKRERECERKRPPRLTASSEPGPVGSGSKGPV